MTAQRSRLRKTGVGCPASWLFDANRGRLFRNVLQVLASAGTFGREKPRTASTSWPVSRVQIGGPQPALLAVVERRRVSPKIRKSAGAMPRPVATEDAGERLAEDDCGKSEPRKGRLRGGDQSVQQYDVGIPFGDCGQNRPSV
jgi:hypothetical protein